MNRFRWFRMQNEAESLLFTLRNTAIQFDTFLNKQIYIMWFFSFLFRYSEISWFSDLPISNMVHPELTKLCGELRFGPKPTPHVICGLARRDGGSRLHKPVFVQIFTKSPFWNPRWLGKYVRPDSSESSLSHLYDTFDWITIDWTTKVLSLGKSPSLSWQAGPFGNLRSLLRRHEHFARFTDFP